MSAFWDDAGATGVGLGSGAATGAMLGSFGGPAGTAIGAGVGGVVGGLTGLFGSRNARKNKNDRQSALDQAMKRLQVMSQEQYANRKADLDATLAFYGPAERALQGMYSGQAPPPIQGPGGPPPPPPRMF